MASPATSMPRKLPNIFITGTPGTGKTTHSTQVYEALSAANEEGLWQHVDVTSFVKEKACHSGWNEHWESYDVDEDKLLDELELIQGAGGKIFDWHTCDMFPERWIDLVVVLRCDHALLWTRLEKRSYPEHKIEENNTAEIMQVVLEDARDSYAEEIIVELTSESPEQVESNVARILQWIENWIAERAEEAAATE